VEINVVPLVDVALVLLIIFMVTATFIRTAGMHIRLPSSSVSHSADEAKKDLAIGVDAAGRFYLEGSRVSEGELGNALRKHASSFGRDCRITVHGDERAAHGRVVRAMTLAQEAGFSRLVIAARKDLPDGSSR
jgi:biopolymer transport protein ExbD